MTYQVLARKWRPKDFSSIVGQEPIITALGNGLQENRIAQAYLFSGIRGVGKTTAARVLAKALNCERGPNPDLPAPNPCNECPPCCEIAEGKDLDFIEVDAATYSKVEQVRELTESLRYGPARDRYKVVVLDEVHRLSRQAFDALLKIVEEPPPHLVFIFATTEIDAVPATILSRCQEFQFRRVPSQVLAQHLRRIAEAESIDVSDNALRLIARAGEGSVRDSVALLDQLATFGNRTIRDDDASNLLGGLDAAIFAKLLRAILEGEPSTILEIIREIEANGWDPHNVYGQFLVYARDALHMAMGARPESMDLPLEEAQTLQEIVSISTYETLLRLTQHLLESEQTLRRSEFAMLALQLAWLRAAELPKLTQIENLLKDGAPSPPRGSTSGAPPRNSSPPVSNPPQRAQDASESSLLKSRANTSRESPNESSSANGTGASESAAPAISLGNIDQQLTHFRDLLSTRRQSLAAHFEATDLDYSEGKLRIRPVAGDPLLESALSRERNASLLTSILSEIWGQGTTWVLDPVKPAAASVASGEPKTLSEKEDPHQDPIVQAVVEIFGAKIESVHKTEST